MLVSGIQVALTVAVHVGHVGDKENPMSRSLRALLGSAGASFTVDEFSTDAVLFRQGDDCDDAWCIESGRVRLSVTSPDGREAIFGPLGAGSLLSDDLLSGHREFRRSAVAIEPTVVLRVPRDKMVALLHTQPAILDYVLGHLMAQHVQLEDALVRQVLYLAEERLAQTLLTWAQCSESAGRCPLPRLSQEVMAEMIGTTRSRVNMFMSRFKKVGFVEATNGEIYVNPSRLSRAVCRGSVRTH